MLKEKKNEEKIVNYNWANVFPCKQSLKYKILQKQNARYLEHLP